MRNDTGGSEKRVKVGSRIGRGAKIERGLRTGGKKG